MAQFTWILPTTVASTSATAAASTGGPITLPAWAPDIEWATTSQNNDWPVMTGSTSPNGATTIRMVKKSIASYTKRTFGMVPATAALDGNKVAVIMITYRAAGELVRA